ncbi:hypothetical protein K2X92_05910 [Candidatus Gracilibacteria bacterium]|nr:hypothetical protein [Candidatus Gracilibacteria bacterium]
MKESIVLSAWEMVTKFHSLKKLNFIPSFMGMLWLFVILFYQLTFSYIYIFDQKDEALEVLSKFLHTDYFGETIVILCSIFLLYMLLEPIATGGIIEMMHSYRQHHGEKNRRSWQGFFDGLRHFLPIFEAHNLTAIFRPLSILTFYILLLRIFGKEYIVPVTTIMSIYLLFAFCINICFSYSKFFIIFEHKGAIESLSASTGLAMRNIAITGRLYFTMILLYFRTIIVAVIFLVIPFLISSFLAFLPTIVGLKLFFLVVFLLISIVLFIFIVHLNSTLEIFVEATWYEAYMLCKEEEKGGHHDNEHHDDHHGGGHHDNEHHDDHHGGGHHDSGHH